MERHHLKGATQHLVTYASNVNVLFSVQVDDNDSQKRTALHVASEAGNAPAVTALLQNNADYDALDMAGDNALHIAVRYAT